MASPAQTAYVNTVPLPPMDPNADPNSILPTGAALSALDPSYPATAQQPVGSAMDAMDGQEEEPLDDLAAQLAAGRRIRITSKEQWAAMSPHQKEVVRAAMSSGGQITSNNAVRIYQDSVKRARATQVQTITTSDGRKVDMVNNQIIPAAKEVEPQKREIRETADGLRAIDPLTGESFQVYDKYSGSAVTGKPKISEDNRVQFNQAHIELQRIQNELNQVNAIPTNKKVTQDDNGMWVPSDSFFGGENPEKVKARLLKDADFQSEKIRKIDPTNSVSASGATPSPSPTPSVTPSPTPRPNPMPTPSGNISKAQYDALAPGSTFTWNGKTYTKK